MKRRSFLASSLAIPSAVALANPDLPGTARSAGTFKLSLKADAIGVEGSAWELLDAAKEYGYDLLSVPAQWLDGWPAADKKKFAGRAAKSKIGWGANGLPIEFRKSDAQFRSDLAALPKHAANLAEIGVTRIGTWILPMHAELTYNANMEQHGKRLRDAARVLKQEGIALGLEYLGTTALRHAERFAFISSGRECKELIAAIGEPNVGVILDSYHWYTARETTDDLMMWSNEEIVAVDLNDANAQLALDQQTDVARELPGATGVIDLDGFLQTLAKIGYDGPVRAEPFSQTLNKMSNDLALRATIDALRGSIARAGL